MNVTRGTFRQALRVLDRCLLEVRNETFRPDVARSGYISLKLAVQCDAESSSFHYVGNSVGDQNQSLADGSVGVACVESANSSALEEEADENHDRLVGGATQHEAVGASHGLPEESESDSSGSSSSSSSGSEVEELEKNVCLTAGLVIPEWKPDCKIVQRKRTKTLRLMAAGVNVLFLCGGKPDKERVDFHGSFLQESWKCKQCDKVGLLDRPKLALLRWIVR